MTNTKNSPTDMYVIKRNGKKEIISFDKILRRIRSISKDQNLKNIIYAQLAIKVIDQLYDNIKTSLIDELTAEQCASMSSTHPDYNKLASAIIISNLHKNTNNSFYGTVRQLYEFKDINNSNYKLIHEKIMQIVESNKDFLEGIIDYERDYLFDYFGFKTLERAYLMRCNNVVIERPQHMWLRVSLCIHENNMDKVKETYDYMSQKYFIHATPTLFNAGTSRPQLSSCYLIGMESDSIDGIFNTVKECAQISKWSGGIGLHIHNIRPNGSHIRGTNGKSNGIIPMLGVFNKTARYVDQGGKRNGSFAIYLEPHHPDIEEFLDLKKNHGDEESKARDLFYGLWISDLFMERVMGNKEWCLFCPDKCPGLSDCYGEVYSELYLKYENLGLQNKKINARDLWIKILDSQMETGTPYILYKDAANSKSNQKNLGTIKSSNLCVAPETFILTDKGYEKIEDLADEEVNVWNGKEFSSTVVKQTSEDSELIDVCLSDETILTCTKYHKFYIYKRSKGHNTNKYIYATIKAQDLKPDMCIIRCKYPVIDNSNLVISNAYEEGFRVENNIRDYLVMGNIPVNYSLETKLEWFAGYCDANGSIVNTNGEEFLEIRSFNNSRLLHIKLMLQTCSANSVVTPDTDNDHIYKHKKLWRMTLNLKQLYKLLDLGFKCKKIVITRRKYTYSTDEFVKIKKIIHNNRHDRTFCFNEPQQHAGIFNGIITSQCTEIIEYSDENETAVCNLASIGLPMFVREDKTFDYDKLYEVARILVNNLNNIIDINFYPTEKTRRSNYNHRPIGIGVQGLADTFFKMDLAFASPEAVEINKLIFETIYYAALEKSYELSRERYEDLDYLKYEYGLDNWSFGTSDVACREYIVYNVSEGSISAAINTDNKIEMLLEKHKPTRAELDKLDDEYLGAYSSFKGSPISNGQFQFDLWNSSPCSERYDWQGLREKIIRYGIRNSLLCAPMPTASTSQILGNNECFEPITSNIYTRKTLAGEFVLINKYLVEELIATGIWNEEIKNNIIMNRGSIQYIEGLSEHIKEKYRIVWEIPMKNLIDMSRDRGIFICQSQSLNLWMEDPDPKSLTNMHFYSWRAGLKTGIYYLRRKAKHQAQQFTIEPEKKKDKDVNESKEEGCLMCSG